MKIQESIITIPTPSGDMRVYTFSPTVKGKFPAIMVWTEIYQVTGPIERLCRLIAGEGYLVVSCESYHEFVTGPLIYNDADTDKGNNYKIQKELNSYDTDARALIDYLLSRDDCTKKIGSIGMCLGGHLSLRSAFHKEVSACVCLFPTDIHKKSLGKPGYDPKLDTLNRLAEIKGECLMIFGKQDNHISYEGRLLIHEQMTKSGCNFAWCELNAAHAFIRDECSKARYDPSLAKISIDLAFELFHRKLFLEVDDIQNKEKIAHTC